MRQTLRREELSFKSGKGWCSTKELSTIATHWLDNYQKFCGLWSPMAHRVAAMYMDVTEMLDMKGQQWTLKLTTWPVSGGPEWPLQIQKAISSCANDASNMKALMPKCQCSPVIAHCSLRVATHGLHKHWDDYGVGPTNKHGHNVLVFCNHFMKHVMVYVIPWPNCKNLLAKFMWQGYISILQSSQPSSWVTKEPILRATSSKSCVNSCAYGRLGLWSYHAQTNGQAE